MKHLFYFLVLISLFSCGENKSNTTSSSASSEDSTEMQYLFIGTYTKKEGHVDGEADGIHRISFQEKGGKIVFDEASKTSFSAVNPSFITFSPDRNFLYAAHELGPNDGSSGTVGTYLLDKKTKDLQFVKSQITKSYAPCHVITDATNSLAFVSNYMGGVSTYKIQDGLLSDSSQLFVFQGKGTTDRQESSHPHSAIISSNNKHVYIADLGTNRLECFEINHEKLRIKPTAQEKITLQDGAGPRHMDFHPNGKWLYVVNELDNTVNRLEYNNKTGELTPKKSVSTLPKDFSGNSYCADIHVHPSGNFVYASNRGHNSIAIFGVDKSSGDLTLVGTESTQGDFPRNFTLSHQGKYLWVANQNTDNIVTFVIDQETGKLSASTSVAMPTPVCLQIL